MRQETGSNNSIAQDKISVRLPAGGDLFVIEEILSQLPEAKVSHDSGEIMSNQNLCVELLTKRGMLTPTELIFGEIESSRVAAAKVAQQELARGGVTYYDDEEVVSLTNGVYTALVVVPKVLLRAIEERYGEGRVAYDVPLLRGPVVKGQHLLVDSCQGVTTVKLFANSDDVESENGDRLLFADVYDSPTDASAIYWVQRVASVMRVNGSTPLYIYRCSGTMRRLLQRNFKKIMVCE